MQNLGVQMPDLQRMFGDNSILGGQLGMQQFDMAQQNQQLNQAGMLQDIFKQEQAMPLELESKRIANQQGLAQLPGIQAQSGLAQDKAELSRKTMPMQLDAQQKKLLADMSEDDVKGMSAVAERMAMSPNPEQRKQGLEMLQFSKVVQQEKFKDQLRHQQRLAELGEQGRQQRLTQKEAIDGGKYLPKGGSGSGGGVPKTHAAAINYYTEQAREAASTGDMQAAQVFMQLAQQAKQNEIEARQAGAMIPKAGTPELGAMGIQTNQPVAPSQLSMPGMTPTAPAAAPTANPATADRQVRMMLQQQNKAYEPDKYEYRIGPNGQVQARPKKGP